MTIIDPYNELAGALRMDPWARDAACAFEGAARILTEGGPAAQALCDSCPVIRQCTTWVLGLNRITDVDHFSAGMTREDRQKARRRIKKARRKQAGQKPAVKPSPKPVRPAPAVIGPPQRKTCSKCGETKNFGEFYAEPRNRDGRSGVCTACKCAARRAGRRVAA